MNADLAARYRSVRAHSEALSARLSAEDCMLQSMADASPVKWHLAHVTWFFETFVLTTALPGYRPFDVRFTMLFNSYYVGVGPRFARPERGLLSRPSLDEVRTYRCAVDESMARLLDDDTLAPATLALIELGIHHEQQHQELIVTDLKHHYSRNPMLPAFESALFQPVPAQSSPTEPLEYIAFAGGRFTLGHEGKGFAFDNEAPAHEVLVGPFALASRLITNGEYLRFIDDGGYQRAELWLSDGWDQCVAQGWQTPLYWFKHDQAWQVYTLAGLRALAPDEPVCHLSYYEADACARWHGARLATEAEWEYAAKNAQLCDQSPSNLADRGAYHPQAAPPAAQLRQMMGDTWEWTASAYLPYPGFRIADGAVGEYNGKFMINQMVLRGGSCATPGDHIRASYRNFFPPAARWQFSGLRLARDVA